MEPSKNVTSVKNKGNGERNTWKRRAFGHNQRDDRKMNPSTLKLRKEFKTIKNLSSKCKSKKLQENVSITWNDSVWNLMPGKKTYPIRDQLSTIFSHQNFQADQAKSSPALHLHAQNWGEKYEHAQIQLYANFVCVRERGGLGRIPLKVKLLEDWYCLHCYARNHLFRQPVKKGKTIIDKEKNKKLKKYQSREFSYIWLLEFQTSHKLGPSISMTWLSQPKHNEHKGIQNDLHNCQKKKWGQHTHFKMQPHILTRI